MEGLLSWLLGNLGWESLKKVFARRKIADVRVLAEALRDAQNRNREFERDQALMVRLVEQRNALKAELIEARRRIVELEAECAKLRRKISKSPKRN